MTKQEQATTDEAATPEKKEPSTPDPKLVASLQAARELYDQGQLEEAEAELQKALKIDPEHYDVNFSLAVIYRDLERSEEAEAIFLKIREREVNGQARVDNNLGVLNDRKFQFEKAIEYYEAAVDREFQFAQPHLNMAFTLLRLGRFEDGWREHEWRWQTEQFTPVKCLQPRWDGSKLEGTLLVHSEQGAGDTFQFIRFMPQIRERCGSVLLMLPDHLMPVIQGDQWADEIISAGTVPLERFQAILPLMSAPYALDTKGDCFGSTVPYLTPEERTVDLGEPHVADTKLMVGICWGGSVTHANNKFRSCDLEQLAPLFEIPNVSFYSVQKGPQVEEIKALSNDKLRDTDPLQNDFADAAAILKQMDLTITVDTSILHLAGALGLPTWALLSKRSDWRWGLDTAETPWYPTVTLHRQTASNDWAELIDRVGKELKQVVAGEKSLASK